jgi:hypothetical protein
MFSGRLGWGMELAEGEPLVDMKGELDERACEAEGRRDGKVMVVDWKSDEDASVGTVVKLRSSRGVWGRPVEVEEDGLVRTIESRLVGVTSMVPYPEVVVVSTKSRHRKQHSVPYNAQSDDLT